MMEGNYYSRARLQGYFPLPHPLHRGLVHLCCNRLHNISARSHRGDKPRQRSLTAGRRWAVRCWRVWCGGLLLDSVG